MFPIEVFIDWLDLKLPDWYAFLSGFFVGLLGVLALSFLVMFFSPDSLFFWMPVILLFTGASAGYKFWQRKKSNKLWSSKLLCLLTGVITAGVATGIQMSVDWYLFKTRTSILFLTIFFLTGAIGSLLGGLLRHKYEKQISKKDVSKALE